MSEATRTAALAHAVTTHAPTGEGPAVVLTTAEAYHTFIMKDLGAAPKTATPAKTPAAAAEGRVAPAAVPDAAAKLAAAKAAAAKAAAKATAAAAAAKSAEDAAVETGTSGEGELDPNSLEAVEAIIADMLSANARKKAVALLAEYSAKSASGVPEESRAEFIEKAQNILLGA